LKYYFMDILACPVCKAHGKDLLLYPIETREEDIDVDIESVRCKSYCSYLGREASQVGIETCRKCSKIRIVTGIIVCLKCGRWYPIIDEIPVMLDDKFRDDKLYARFLRQYWDRIPSSVREKMRNPNPQTLLERTPGEE